MDECGLVEIRYSPLASRCHSILKHAITCTLIHLAPNKIHNINTNRVVIGQ